MVGRTFMAAAMVATEVLDYSDDASSGITLGQPELQSHTPLSTLPAASKLAAMAACAHGRIDYNAARDSESRPASTVSQP